MKAIINGKLYDTEKASKVGNLEHGLYEVYKTGKGNLFLVNTDFDEITNADQDKIKEFIGQQNPYLYFYLFSEVEEA